MTGYKKRGPFAVTCDKCGTPFSSPTSNAKHCAVCRMLPTSTSPYRGRLSTATVGALHELLVAADLLKRGYAVFRAVSPACPCDIAILKDGKLVRVEVTTGVRQGSGRIGYPPKTLEAYDLLAVVLHDGSISYVGTANFTVDRLAIA